MAPSCMDVVAFTDTVLAALEIDLRAGQASILGPKESRFEVLSMGREMAEQNSSNKGTSVRWRSREAALGEMSIPPP